MNIISSKEEYNQYNGYRIRKYELDTEISDIGLLSEVLKSFEVNDIKIDYCMGTSFDVDEQTGRHFFKNVDEMVEKNIIVNDFVFFDASYVDCITGEYAFAVVVYSNKKKLEQVFNPNKLSKNTGSVRKK